jgi:hypothetical protein
MNVKKSKPDHRSGLLTAVKVFLVTSMLAVTVGIWSILSRQSREIQAIPGQMSSAPYANAPENGPAMLPIPTLVSLQEVNLNNTGNVAPNFADVQPTPALRQVPLPVPTTLPLNKPLIVQGGGPITSSGSSR